MAQSLPLFFVVVAVVCTAVTVTPVAVSRRRRRLFGDTAPPSPAPPTPAPNALSPHDRVCREYLKNFLTGTTDAADECMGLQNAYAAADCVTAGDVPYDPWKRWWHDLIGDDDWSPGGGPDTGDGVGRSLLSEDDDAQIPMIDDRYEDQACCSTMRSYYVVRCSARGTAIDSTVLLITSSILIACGIVKALQRSVTNPFIKSFPEAVGCILMGALAGIVVRWGVPGVDLDLDRLAFDPDLFLSIFLPPIIFQATLAIDKAALGRNLINVVTFAIIGTFLSAALTSVIVYVATQPLANPLPALDAAIFGALISSIDPVATLSMLSSVGFSESDTIYIMVFGESLLNDGVAIVLFRVLLDHLHQSDEDETFATFIGSIARRFFLVSLGSILIGIASGVACTFYFWVLQGRHSPVVEVGMFFVWALMPYYIGEVASCSSVTSMMATLFFTDLFVIGRHTDATNIAECRENSSRRRMFSTSGQLSLVSRRYIGFVAEVVSSLMEDIIFTYLGLFLFSEKHFNLALSFIAIAACVGSRAVMVAFLSWTLNTARAVHKKCQRMCCDGREPYGFDGEEPLAAQPLPQRPHGRQFLNRYAQKILFLSGIRGAVSLALVESIPVFNAVAKEGSKFKVELKTMTMSSIIFTVFTFGSATYRLIHKEGSHSPENRDQEDNLGERMSEPLLREESTQNAQHPRNDEGGQLVEFDRQLGCNSPTTV